LPGVGNVLQFVGEGEAVHQAQLSWKIPIDAFQMPLFIERAAQRSRIKKRFVVVIADWKDTYPEKDLSANWQPLLPILRTAFMTIAAGNTRGVRAMSATGARCRNNFFIVLARKYHMVTLVAVNPIGSTIFSFDSWPETIHRKSRLSVGCFASPSIRSGLWQPDIGAVLVFHGASSSPAASGQL
jgi:hypothetical protein